MTFVGDEFYRTPLLCFETSGSETTVLRTIEKIQFDALYQIVAFDRELKYEISVLDSVVRCDRSHHRPYG
jgi:hypothetical protein